MLVTVLLIVVVVLVTGVAMYLAMNYQARGKLRESGERFAALSTELTSRQADFSARQDDFRTSLVEAQKREGDAVRRADDLDRRLKVTLEERGKFTAGLGRMQELTKAVGDRDEKLEAANSRILDLEKSKASAESEARGARERADLAISKERQSTREILEAKDQQIKALDTFIATAREVMGTEFKALSSDVLQGASEQLVKANTEHSVHQQSQVEGLLKPVQDTMERLNQYVGESNTARARAETLLDDQVKRLAGATEVLTNALKKPVMRGSWGEMQLENALENAGLEAEIDYVLQHTTDGEDGKKRTDAIINLPKGRKLIVDSKNLMETYYAYAAAENLDEKDTLGEVHARSLRTHIKSLSSKEYWRRYEGLDCVILFIPHDGMYHAAIRDESDLLREASNQRVFVANPMTLIPLLKAVGYVLDQDRLNKSAAAISGVGAELYAEIARFAENFAAVGARIKATVNAYNSSLPGLDRFILSRSRKLKQLGAARGDEPELPDTIETETRELTSDELAKAPETISVPLVVGEDVKQVMS